MWVGETCRSPGLPLPNDGGYKVDRPQDCPRGTKCSQEEECGSAANIGEEEHAKCANDNWYCEKTYDKREVRKPLPGS